MKVKAVINMRENKRGTGEGLERGKGWGIMIQL